jgi:hypothetical protein
LPNDGDRLISVCDGDRVGECVSHGFCSLFHVGNGARFQVWIFQLFLLDSLERVSNCGFFFPRISRRQ